MIKNFPILKRQDLYDILEISELQLGGNYLDFDYLSSYAQQANAWIQVIKENEKVIAFSFMRVFTLAEALNYFKDKPSVLFNLFQDDQKYAFRELTVVHPDFQGKGIASQLVREGISFLKNKASILFCEAWESDKGVHIASVLENNGYIAWKRIPDYWKTESWNNQYICKRCGAPPCRCTSVIYIHDLKD